MITQQFRNRQDAGQQLAQLLRSQGIGVNPSAINPHSDQTTVLATYPWIVVGLPRGGIVVACEVALALRAPLDVCVVRKLGLPSQPELAMGAIAMGGYWWLDKPLIRAQKVSPTQVSAVLHQEQDLLNQRQQRYQPYRPQASLEGARVVIVDDGMATGATLRVALDQVRSQHPQEIIVAMPVAGSTQWLQALNVKAFVVHQPQPLVAIGYAYQDFTQVSDSLVCQTLQETNKITFLANSGSA